jgi:hypothetical protein
LKFIVQLKVYCEIMATSKTIENCVKEIVDAIDNAEVEDSYQELLIIQAATIKLKRNLIELNLMKEDEDCCNISALMQVLEIIMAKKKKEDEKEKEQKEVLKENPNLKNVGHDRKGGNRSLDAIRKELQSMLNQMEELDFDLDYGRMHRRPVVRPPTPPPSEVPPPPRINQ